MVDKRRTEFDSSAAKLAYDAEGLINLAKQRYRKDVVTVSEALDLRSRDNPESGTDDVEGLRRAIAIRLKTKPAYEAFVDGLGLAEVDREKLKAMMTIEEYNSALKTYYEEGGNKNPPSFDQIAAELMTWSVDRLRGVCEEAEKPTLVIVSDRSFDDKISAMDRNKHYKSGDKSQEDAFVNRGENSSYLNVAKPQRGRVSIVDGVMHPKQLAGVSPKLGERREHLTEKFKRNGMRHIDGVEMATLLQKSIKEAEDKNDNNLIVDNWESGVGTATFINPESLTKSTLVAYASFDSNYRQVYFNADFPDYGNDDLRGRASVQVMEF